MSKPFVPPAIMLAFYSGNSLFSRLIKWQTRGRYSHAAVLVNIQDNDGGYTDLWRVVEAVEGRGVIWRHTHLSREPADFFNVRGLNATQEALAWLYCQVGKKYDWKMCVLGFVLRKNQESRKSAGKWFCSELAYAFAAKCGRYLFRDTEPYEVSPVMLSKSPLLIGYRP